MTGPADDPHDRPTRMTEVSTDDSQVLEREAPSVGDTAPQPWYRNRALLVLWALMVALLLTLIGYGVVELSRGGGSTSVPSRNSSTTTTPSTTSTTNPTPTPSTTTEDTSPPESPEQTPEEAPPPNESPAPAEPPHHHHHLHVPSTIQLPHTVITVPHGF